MRLRNYARHGRLQGVRSLKRDLRVIRSFWLLCCLFGEPARAEDQELIVRAIGQPPQRELVDYLARSAQPQVILQAEHPDYADLGYSDIAIKRCGSLYDGYLDALIALNPGTVIDRAGKAGSQAFTLKWPACLEIRNNVTYKVRKDDNPTSIRLELTGEFAAGPEIDTYFEKTGLNPRTAKLKPEQELYFPFRTLKTRVMMPSERVETFISELKRIGGRRVQAERPTVHGALVGPARTGGTLSANEDCTYETDDDYPFNALKVANAYNAYKTSQNTVYVAVVDNGFFGVPCSTSECPSRLASEGDYSPRFPKRFFARPSYYLNYGANLGTQHILGPINYPDLAAADVNEISGHGTHVAGLVLGGPTFLPYRSTITDQASGDGRVALSIVAVSRGSLEIDSQTEARIGTAIESMSSPTIVNMSFAFEDPETESIFRTLLQRTNTLFVAAAGNDGRSLEDDRIYPAALGGKGLLNLITVASIDSTGKLSAFSNYGTAADLAAPGCKIVSWLDAERDVVPISGTSQAAPLVTFAGALLYSKFQVTPRILKNRLIYSGDLITDPTSRQRVWSGTRLNIPKALYFRDDYVAVKSNQSVDIYLGRIERFGGVTCGSKERLFDEIRSLKRASDSEVWVYTDTSAGPVAVCPGKLAERAPADPNVAVMLSFKPRAHLQGASIVEVQPDSPPITFKARDLVEFVRGFPDN